MAIPRYKPTAWPALFSMGFRPFFLLSALWAVIAMVVWLAMLSGAATVPTAFGPIAWHAHEMLFGFVVAAMTGFLLTAVPNWTGRMPLQGAPLAGLAALWCAGRAAVAASAVIGPVSAAAIDVAYLVVLLATVLREILAGRNWRNLPIALVLALLALANGLSHGAALGAPELGQAGLRLAIGVIVMLISLIGGRIVPSFTGNWLRKRGAARLPAPAGAYDRAALALTAAGLLAWVIAPEESWVVALVGLAAVGQAVRLLRWRGLASRSEPLVWVLHLGYAWVPAGLALLAVAPFAPGLGQGAALHALTAGAMGTMILAVTTRATLGHSGRELTADGVTVAAYLSVTLAALARIGAAAWSAAGMAGYLGAGGLWIAAFALFLLRYGPIHLFARPYRASS